MGIARDPEKNFAAFSSDPEWIEARRKSEEEGPIDASITNTILMPTALWIAMSIARRLHACVCDLGWTFSLRVPMPRLLPICSSPNDVLHGCDSVSRS